MKITILTDNESSWFIPYAKKLNNHLLRLGHDCSFVSSKDSINNGDVCFLLSCIKILPEKYLGRNTHNIVIHASDLPQGKGFSPLQWQILESKNQIPLTLFEAVKDLDAGDYYFKDYLTLDGHELLDEIHEKLGLKIIELAIRFVENIAELNSHKQVGKDSYYPRRTKKDDEINPNLTIKELFNHFRIADNLNYPLYFEMHGYKYNLKIEKRNE
jgi:methionyl-tRNA formyltransferase